MKFLFLNLHLDSTARAKDLGSVPSRHSPVSLAPEDPMISSGLLGGYTRGT